MEAAMLSTAELIFNLMSMWNNEEEIKNLADTIDLIRDVLSEVEGKQFKEESVKKVYKRLRNAFLDAEDFLDRVHTLKEKKDLKARMNEQLESYHEGKRSVAFAGIKLKLYKNKARRFFSSSNQVKYALEVNNTIKKIRKNLDAISEDMQKFGPKVPSSSSEATQMTARARGCYVNPTDIIGRDEDKRKIVDLLLRSSVDQKKIPVISIVGIGGMGKTTVAQLVYDDMSWQESCQFDMKLWVSDSKKFDLKSLLKHILKSICPKETGLDELEEDHLRQRIVDKIRGKRFLLVLDDVENENRLDWKILEGLLNCGAKESRILVTTRSRKVAVVVGSSPDETHELTGLSEEDSLQLFESFAFEENRDESLVEIGNLIVEKCCGVPLAIKVVGSLLYGEGKRKWEYVRDNSLADIADEGNQIMDILKMSYDVLDSTLKQCFAFCALFPKNYRFSMKTLSNIWMANDCFKTAKCETLEDACDKNLRILFNRGFLEASLSAFEKIPDEWDDVEYFKMHDLMHDLAKEVAGAEILVVDSISDNVILKEDVRHVMLDYGASTFEPKGRRLRTFLQCDYRYRMSLNVDKIVSECPVLRYLDMKEWRIKNLTNSIGELIHLRYLCLSHNEFQSLPDSITELINLRRLELAFCGELTHLPSGMGALTSLEVLDISWCMELKELPRGIEKLMKLKKLLLEGCMRLAGMPSGMGALLGVCEPGRFIVGDRESKHTAQLEELGPLSDLPAKLKIELPSNTIRLKERIEDGEAFLFNKKSLRQLEICWLWQNNPEEEVLRNQMEILGKLQPPTSLEEFVLSGYQGMTFPAAWMPKDGFASVVPNLVLLSIQNCRGCRYLPPLSRLHCLRYLHLYYLISLEYIEEENDSDAPFCLPQLESLELKGLPELKGWCRGLATNQSLVLPSFPRLSRIHIRRCPKLRAPTLLSVVKAFDLSSSSFHLFAEQVCKNSSGGFVLSKGEEDSLRLRISGFNATGTPSSYMAEAFRGMSHQLTDLSLYKCSGLKTLPGLQHLTALRKLKIQDCDDFTWEEEKLQSVEEVGDDISMESLNITTSPPSQLLWEGLRSLRELRLRRLPKMVRLPEGIQYVTSLQKIDIVDCKNLIVPEWPTLCSVIHHLDVDATGLENQGANSNDEPLGKPVLEFEKELEARRLLFLFEKGYEFEKEMVIQLWMALGILTDEPMELIGANYFEKLVYEGYISCSGANSFYKVSAGKMKTDLDMIRRKNNYVTLDNGSGNDVASTETLHVSIICDEIDESVITTLGRFKRLKILLFLRNYGSRLQEVPRDLLLCYESIVALDLSGAHIKELPSSAEKMIHLRFLDLSWTLIEFLPERIDHFERLQTLKLKGCSRLHRLPKEMKRLTKLRYLDLDVLGQLATFPEGIGALVNLRTLSGFPVGIEEGLKISELKNLDNLTGEFCIAKLENVQSAEEAKGASLTTKRSIKKLELRWSDYQFQEPKNEDAAIFENLCPCLDLEEIKILCYPGTSFPAWIAGLSFHKLVSITLFRCVHVSVLPSLEKLPALVSLELISLNSVENVNFKGEVGNVAFPKLRTLAVDEMLNVESWAEAEEGDFPCLVKLSIKDCPKLPELPSLVYLPFIEHLEVSGCTKLAFVSDKELSNSLLQLIVEDCPLIKERCSDQAGQDWYKIEHVPTIWIDEVAIKTNEELIDNDDDDESYYSDAFE